MPWSETRACFQGLGFWMWDAARESSPCLPPGGEPPRSLVSHSFHITVQLWRERLGLEGGGGGCGTRILSMLAARGGASRIISEALSRDTTCSGETNGEGGGGQILP